MYDLSVHTHPVTGACIHKSCLGSTGVEQTHPGEGGGLSSCWNVQHAFSLKREKCTALSWLHPSIREGDANKMCCVFLRLNIRSFFLCWVFVSQLQLWSCSRLQDCEQRWEDQSWATSGGRMETEGGGKEGKWNTWQMWTTVFTTWTINTRSESQEWDQSLGSVWWVPRVSCVAWQRCFMSESGFSMQHLDLTGFVFPGCSFF